MKAVFALVAVLFVLQSRSVYAGAFAVRHLSDNVSEYASYIPSVASELFTAVFNANGVSVSYVINFPLNDTQGCLKAHNISTLIDVAHAGTGILHSVGIPGIGFQNTNVNQLQDDFVANISHCGALHSTKDKLNCYASEISDLFRIIAAANHDSIYINKPKILYHLIALGKSLAKDNARLKQCLALFSDATTTERPTSSESVLSTLSTLLPSLGGSSAETETTSASTLSPLSTIFPHIGK